MAMLRVSSYRRLFEEGRWGRESGAALMCGGQYRASARGRAAGTQWVEPDFEAAQVVNRDAVSRFGKERALIAALNDRLACLIETARCLEEENQSLEAQILELEERRGGLDASATPAPMPDCGLQAVVESLQREKEQILCDTEKLQKELEMLQLRHEQAAEQTTLVQLEKEEVAVDVDTLCNECLALRDQVAIYESELDRLQEEHQTTIESLVEPADGVATVTVEFPTPDVTPAILGIKEYYCQLEESLQFEFKATSLIPLGDQKDAAMGKVEKGRVADASKVRDVGELKNMIAELQRELADLEQRGEDLEVEIEERREVYLEEIADLECCVEEIENAQAELDAQMREQCADYDELLSEKMALDIEIAAYRGLVEQEEDRLCFL
ncbi:type III intermediate filament [Anguilla rostrata]|uniref:type III intermediate filament n=1 Tax=Anguilla rostrata TaxID=7938 RepID=UPI0030D47672